MIVQLERARRLVGGTHGTHWRSLLRAGVATAVIVTAIPADAAWFIEPRAIAVPLPDLDPAAIKLKRLSLKRKNAADARSSERENLSSMSVCQGRSAVIRSY